MPAPRCDAELAAEMRILFVQRDRWPRSIGGSEFYEHHLSTELSNRHEIGIFCGDPRLRTSGIQCSADAGRALFEVAQDWELYPGSPSEERVRSAFREILDRFRPDLVHFHDLCRLSIALPRIARRRGIPVVHTLHDFFLMCPRIILRTTGNRLCRGPSARGCFDCARDMASERYVAKLGGERLVGRIKRRLKAAAQRRATEIYFALLRGLQIRSARAAIAAFLCPSQTLHDRLRAHGIPEHKLRVLAYGLPELGAPRPKQISDRVRFAFVGNPTRHKGIFVLIEAARRVPEVEVVVYGPLTSSDAPTLRVEAANVPNVRLAGILSDAEKAEAYAGIDVLVAPSIWYENQPFTILEAFHFATPVLTNRLGGMEELMRHGGGWVVEPERPDALAEIMRGLARHPTEIAAAARAIPPVPSLAEQVRHLERIYAEVVV